MTVISRLNAVRQMEGGGGKVGGCGGAGVLVEEGVEVVEAFVSPAVAAPAAAACC